MEAAERAGDEGRGEWWGEGREVDGGVGVRGREGQEKGGGRSRVGGLYFIPILSVPLAFSLFRILVGGELLISLSVRVEGVSYLILLLAAKLCSCLFDPRCTLCY